MFHDSKIGPRRRQKERKNIQSTPGTGFSGSFEPQCERLNDVHLTKWMYARLRRAGRNISGMVVVKLSQDSVVGDNRSTDCSAQMVER